MNEEIQDSEIERLLGQYGDAFERHASQVNTTDVEGSIASNNNSEAVARVKGSDMLGNQLDRDVLSEIEPVGEVSPTPAVDESGRRKVLVGACAVILALVIGGVYALTSGPSEVDTSEVAEQPELDETSTTINEAAEDDTVEPEPEPDPTTNEAAAGVAEVPMAGLGTALFSDGEFVTIGLGSDGVIVSRSADGVTWSNEATTGLPERAVPNWVVEFGDGWAMLLQNIPDLDPAAPAAFVGSGSQEIIATSTDLINWDVTEFPEDATDNSEVIFGTSMATSNGQLAILLQRQATSGEGDAVQLLLDAGVVTSAEVAQICGTEFSEGGPFIGTTCEITSIGNGGEDVEEVVADNELFSIAPGDPLYDEVAELMISSFEDFEFQAPIVVTGPASGPFEVVELPVDGLAAGIAGTDEGFAVVVSDVGEVREAVALSSSDGVNWTQASVLGEDVAISALTVHDGRIVAINQNFSAVDPVTIFTSDDLAQTWTETAIPTELFDVWGQLAAGPAGIVVQLDGSSDDGGPTSPSAADPFELTKDGFTMTFNLLNGEAGLIGPDGVTIYDQVGLDIAEGSETIFRFEGPNDETLIWLDPETGEDLVFFTEDDFDEQFEAAGGQIDQAVLESRVTEVWFSPDGVAWTLIRDGVDTSEASFTTLAGVGDDEVLVRSQSIVEPPAELLEHFSEGREPTAEEEAALEEWFMESSAASTWELIPVG